MVSGILVARSTNKYALVPPMQYNKVSIRLPGDRVWRLGFDQSTSCTGIFMMDKQMDCLVMFEMLRDCDKETYYRELYYFIRNITQGRKIEVVVCEKPVPSKHVYTSGVLREFLGRLDVWVGELFPDADYGKIYPQTWKSFVIDKSKGKNRSNNKACIAEDVCDIFPLLDEYKKRKISKDFDGFDAAGVLLGYTMYAYSPNGSMLIHGEEEKRHVSFVCYKYVRKDSLGGFNFKQELFGYRHPYFSPKALGYNNRYSRFKNIRMASSNWKCVLTVLPDSEVKTLRFRFPIQEDTNYCMVMIVFSKKYLTKTNKDYLESQFPFHEEVSDV